MKPTFEKLCAAFHSEIWLDDALMNEWDVEMLGKFSGCDYKFVRGDKDHTLSIKIGTVEKSKRGKVLYHYDCDGYCKRLNTYSIPVVEHLLRPLKDLFLEKEYDGAVYNFEWE